MFFALYATLDGAVELRQVSFLWAKDLAAADTVLTIPLYFFNLPINPLVLIMTGLMVVQQHMTPMSLDPMQKKMMLAMPIIMLLFLYDLPSGLTLYWSVSNFFSIIQMRLQRRHYNDQGATPGESIPASSAPPALKEEDRTMSENEKFEERKAKIVKSLTTMFDYLGLSASLRVEEKGTRIGVKISSEDAGRIIGRKGQTLESLQLLLNRIMFKDDEECPHIMLDIDGYAKGERGARSEADDESEEGGERRPRERRERRPRREEDGERTTKDQLEQQALDAAKEVKRWGEPVTLPEMNAHDRRIIHVTLKDDPELTTESMGEGAMKKVVISLKKED